MCSSRCWLTTGALLAGLAVATGAFAAHGLDSYFQSKYAGQLDESKAAIEGVAPQPMALKQLANFKTGAEYQMYHGLALLALGLVARSRSSRGLSIAGACFVAGILGFSGGLYAYALTGMKWIVAVIPIGGTLFLVGWVALAIAVCRTRE